MSTEVVTIDGETGELVPAERADSGLALSVGETVRLLELVHQAKRELLHPGKGGDYWVIPGTGAKPTLLKPGAEKLLAFFRYRIAAMTRTETQTEPHFGCAYECRIENPAGQTVAVCEGWADQGEPGMKNRDNTLRPRNAVMKMAQKRAMVGAVLNACAASALFTQDLEDHELPAEGNVPPAGGPMGGPPREPPVQGALPSAPPAAATQGSAGTASRPAPVEPPKPLSPGKAEFVALMEELGIRNTHPNRTRAIEALQAHKLTSDDLVKPAERRRAEKVLRVAFGVKERASVVVPVPSASKPGEKHEVKLTRLGDEVGGTCDCEWAQWHADCRHIPAAWRMLELSWLTDQPIGVEREWDGIDIAAVAQEADERYEDAKAKARGERSPEDEAAERAWAASAPKDGDG